MGPLNEPPDPRVAGSRWRPAGGHGARQRLITPAAAAALLAVLVLFLLAGAVPLPGGAQTVVFRTPLFSLLAALAAGLAVLHGARPPWTWRSLGIRLIHLGVAVLLAGAFLSALLGQRGEIIAPVGDSPPIREVPLRDGTRVSLGFGLAIDRLDDAGELPGGVSAALRLQQEDGSSQARTLAVNHPADRSGWRIYLMSHTVDRRGVLLALRRDPGRIPAFAGMWVLLAGVAIVCFRKEDAGHGAA